MLCFITFGMKSSRNLILLWILYLSFSCEPGAYLPVHITSGHNLYLDSDGMAIEAGRISLFRVFSLKR